MIYLGQNGSNLAEHSGVPNSEFGLGQFVGKSSNPENCATGRLKQRIGWRITVTLRLRGSTKWSRVLIRFVGVSPHRYVVHLRWQRVVELVRHVRSGLADVAVRTGFADQAISGPARPRRFPDGTGRPSPKSRNLQDQRLPFS